MKTIQSNSASKANMRTTRKSEKTIATPSNNGQKNDKDSSTGKKLKQARLPFKILTGTPPTKPLDEAGASSTDITEAPSKKRKLSFTEEPENQKKIAVDVIVLDDEESDGEDRPSVSKSPKTPVVASGGKSQKKKNKSTPKNANGNENSTTPKLQIKLPLSGKKKRKSKSAAQSNAKTEASDGSDVELISDEPLNPLKKPKLDDLPKEDVNDDIASIKSVDHELKKDIDDKKSSLSHNTSKSVSKKQCDSSNNIEPQTPKSSKNKSPGENSDESKLRALDESPIKTSITETPQTSESKIEDNSETSQESEEEKSNEGKDKSTSIKKKSSKDEKLSPAKETRSKRRSLRVSESEKNKKEEVLSSEPELVSESTNAADTSLNKTIEKNTKLLTPKQQKLMEQRKKAREEKEFKLQQLKEERERKLQEQREERERKQQEEKMQKQKEREERESLRKKEREEKEEQKRREREEKEDQRRKEKEDKERKRLAEIEAKNEEKRKKDEAKEEERRKKDEDRRRKELEKEEEENKKKKAAEAFTKFFVAKPTKTIPDEESESRDGAESVDSLAFRPFQIKGDMKLAPLVRREFKEGSREKLDSFLQSNQANESALYLAELKNGTHTPLRGYKTVLKNNFEDDDDDDVVVIANELENAGQTIDEPRNIPTEKFRAKYYLFRENRRPPFYGTWRKKSSIITPRKPFATDKAFFDYEVDSDEEWEEEEPGESLNGSEDEKDESEDDDYEVDNEWFVPHGHLSDEELQNEDEIGPDTSREAQKAKLKVLQQEFAQEMKKKTEKIRPRLIGAIWVDENGNRPKLCPTVIWESLCSRAMIYSEPPLVEAAEVAEPESSTPPPEKQQRIKIKDDLMKDLVRLVHGNRHSRVFLIKEYTEHVCNTCETIKNGECLAPTKSQIKEKIDEIAEWSALDIVNKKNKNRKKLCWVVSADILDKYGLGNLSLHNEWSYKLQPKFDKDINEQIDVTATANDTPKEETPPETVPTEKKKQKQKPSGIKKFITKDEKTNQKSASTTKSSPKASKTASASPKTHEVPNSETKTFKKPAPPAAIPTKSPKAPVIKKRVALLMSVPPGQQFSPQSKNALISKFLQKNKTAAVAKSTESDESSKVTNSSIAKMDVDEVVVIE